MSLTVKTFNDKNLAGEKVEALHDQIKRMLAKTDCSDEEIRLQLAIAKQNPPRIFDLPQDEWLIKREIDRWYRMDRDFMKYMLGLKTRHIDKKKESKE
jgi:hypothetical protein